MPGAEITDRSTPRTTRAASRSRSARPTRRSPATSRCGARRGGAHAAAVRQGRGPRRLVGIDGPDRLIERRRNAGGVGAGGQRRGDRQRQVRPVRRPHDGAGVGHAAGPVRRQLPRRRSGAACACGHGRRAGRSAAATAAAATAPPHRLRLRQRRPTRSTRWQFCGRSSRAGSRACSASAPDAMRGHDRDHADGCASAFTAPATSPTKAGHHAVAGRRVAAAAAGRGRRRRRQDSAGHRAGAGAGPAAGASAVLRGLDLSQAAYEWNYGRQLLAIRLHESGQGRHGRCGRPVCARLPARAPAAAGDLQRRSPACC